MKILKKFLIAIGVLFAIYLILCLFGPAHVTVERTGTINAPVEAVFEQVNSLKNWENWDAWHKADPDATYEYSGAEAGVGCKNSWDGEIVMQGTQEITESVENESIKSTLTFGEMVAYGEIALSSAEGGTEMIWSLDMDIPFMFRGMSLFMNHDAAGKDFEDGMDGLNEYFATNEPTPTVEVSEVMTEPMWVVSVTDTLTIDELMSSASHERMYGELGLVFAENGIEMAGQPMAIWHSFPDPVVMEACFPVGDSVALAEGTRAICRLIPATKAVEATHWGWYDGLDKHNELMHTWMAENGYTASDLPSWDVYEDFEQPLEDTSTVATHVYIPVN